MVDLKIKENGELGVRDMGNEVGKLDVGRVVMVECFALLWLRACGDLVVKGNWDPDSDRIPRITGRD